jgi:predicted patatin/cPLA2 family phospholipase
VISSIPLTQNKDAGASLFGVRKDAVIDLVRSRRRLSSPRDARDGRKLALLVEGGGMRGVCSAGGLVALDALGLRNAFDGVYASSAGAMNAAYMLSGQATFGIQIYYKYVNNKNFISFQRFNKIVDIDFLFDIIVTKLRALDTAKLLEAPSDFYVGVVNKATGETILLKAQDHPSQILQILKASTALPVVYNRGVVINSNEFIDGGLVDPVPLNEAIADGCTDLLVFLTLPYSYSLSNPPLWEDLLFGRFCANGNRALHRAFREGYPKSDLCRQICLGKLPPPKQINIATFCPAERGTILSRTVTDPKRLKQAAVELATATLEQFDEGPALIADLLQS